MESSASNTPDIKGRKILIVDDDRINLRILTGILRPDGYTLAEADSGERANRGLCPVPPRPRAARRHAARPQRV